MVISDGVVVCIYHLDMESQRQSEAVYLVHGVQQQAVLSFPQPGITVLSILDQLIKRDCEGSIIRIRIRVPTPIFTLAT